MVLYEFAIRCSVGTIIVHSFCSRLLFHPRLVHVLLKIKEPVWSLEFK